MERGRQGHGRDARRIAEEGLREEISNCSVNLKRKYKNV